MDVKWLGKQDWSKQMVEEVVQICFDGQGGSMLVTDQTVLRLARE